MARGGDDERGGDSSQKCEAQRLGTGGGTHRPRGEGGRAPRSGGAAAAGGGGCGRGAARVAGGRAWSPVVGAALRPRGQVRAAGTRPEARAPEPALQGRWEGRDAAGPDTRRLGGVGGRLGEP